jgi:HAMP domain-containing protein
MSDSAVTTKSTPHKRGFSLGIRWKLLISFATVFTVVFAFIALWIFSFTTNVTKMRLEDELARSSTGGAASIDAVKFAALNATVPSVPDPSNDYGLGYPTSPLYNDIATQLYAIRLVVEGAKVYSYYKDPTDGLLYFSASAGYKLETPAGVTFKVPVAEVVDPATYGYMDEGLTAPTNQPEYTDDFGSFISAYSPILDDSGVPIGAVGMDYPQTYVSEVQDSIRTQLFPVLLGSYIVLLGLVVVVSTSISKPLRRLQTATRRIADGEYDLDVVGLVTSRFPDEMYDLAESFEDMAAKVAQRERSLTQEVQRLKVEINHARREESVKEITESDFFADLTTKAAEMRRRARGDDQ